MKALLAAIVLTITLNTHAQGLIDGFFKGKGVLDVAGGLAFENANKYYALNKIEYGRSLFIINSFGEYGITNKWDVIASVPLINGTLQDASLFTKYEIIKFKGFSVIPAIGVSFPLSDYNTETSQAIGQRATNLQGKLVLQYKPNSPWFVQAQGGYQYTLEPVPNAYGWSTKVGYGKGKWYADLWYDQQISTGEATFLGNIPYSTFRELGVDYQRIGGVVYYQFRPKFGLSLAASRVINGRNIGEASIVGVSGVWKIGFKE